MFDAPVGLILFALAILWILIDVALLGVGHHLRTVQLRRQRGRR